MKPRTCRICISIANDAGAANCYSLKPLPPADIGLSVSGFSLVNLTEPPHAVYSVRLATDGQVSCDCPAFNRGGRCKHGDALTAAGLLPCRLLGLLLERSRQLDAAEAESQRLAEAAMEERTVHEHDARASSEQVADLLASVANLNERCARLQAALAAAEEAARPKRRRGVRKAA